MESYGGRVVVQTNKPPPMSMYNFRRKYPYANFFKFYEDTDDVGRIGVFTNAGNLGSVSVTDPEFLRSKDAKWLTSNKPQEWPKVWKVVGRMSMYQGRAKIGFDISNFRIYVNDKDYFLANLPSIALTWSKGRRFSEHPSPNDIRRVPFDYNKEPYFAMLCGAYIASYHCGISLANIDSRYHPIINSLVKYHFYYQIRKFIAKPSLIDRFDCSYVKDHIPTTKFWVTVNRKDDDGNTFQAIIHKELSNKDYLSFISTKSTGLTNVGFELFQESIESYVYSILGAQAKTRWSITNQGAKSLQTQQAFRAIVEDTVIQSDVTVLISNMRTAIDDTNVILNLSIVPGIILVPSNMTILKDPIPGYSNTLTVANSSTMKFGVNSKVNYSDKPVVKTAPKVLTPAPKTIQKTIKPTKINTNYNDELMWLFIGSAMSVVIPLFIL